VIKEIWSWLPYVLGGRKGHSKEISLITHSFLNSDFALLAAETLTLSKASMSDCPCCMTV